MADQDREQGGRGRSRQGGQRDGAGGFRIRLSDNELQAARTLQEAFQLRSTVAVLGSPCAPWLICWSRGPSMR